MQCSPSEISVTSLIIHTGGLTGTFSSFFESEDKKRRERRKTFRFTGEQDSVHHWRANNLFGVDVRLFGVPLSVTLFGTMDAGQAHIGFGQFRPSSTTIHGQRTRMFTEGLIFNTESRILSVKNLHFPRLGSRYRIPGLTKVINTTDVGYLLISRYDSLNIYLLTVLRRKRTRLSAWRESSRLGEIREIPD